MTSASQSRRFQVSERGKGANSKNSHQQRVVFPMLSLIGLKFGTQVAYACSYWSFDQNSRRIRHKENTAFCGLKLRGTRLG
jgi:hypothetical protein